MTNYWQQMQPTQTSTIPANPGIMLVPVQGEAGAQMYPVAAGNTVFLADFDAKLAWLKTTAPNGLPQQMRKFKLEEITPPAQNAVAGGVTREEFDELKKMIASLVGGIKQNVSAATTDESTSVSQ